MLMEDAAETRKLGLLEEEVALGKLRLGAGEERRRGVNEARERRAGEVRGAEMVAAVAMTLTTKLSVCSVLVVVSICSPRTYESEN